MAVNSGEDERPVAHSVLMCSDGGTNSPECEPQSLLEVRSSTEPQMCFDDQLKCQKHSDVKVDVLDIYAPSILDVDIEKGKFETVKSKDETLGSLKTEDSFTHFQRALQREISLQVGGKFMQLLMNNSLELPKFASRDKCMTERVNTPTNRSRKYKRSSSFNSRRVVLLFSVLSCMGTIILIYLTLRVRQITEAATTI